MKALLLTEYKVLELTEMPEPPMGPDDVLVRVKACGICGSDIHGFDGSTGRRIPPLVMGHEAAGFVAKTGSNVTQFRVGERVTFDSTVYCGKCYFCRRGAVNLCDNRQVLGVSPGEYRRHGAFAEYVAVPQHITYPIPETLSFEHAAMIEAVSVAVHAVGLTPVRLDDTAVVVGFKRFGWRAAGGSSPSIWTKRGSVWLGNSGLKSASMPVITTCRAWYVTALRAEGQTWPWRSRGTRKLCRQPSRVSARAGR
jgi:L-iditol 2-dehydrogenase